MRSTPMLLLAAGCILLAATARADDAAKKYEPRVAFAETDKNRDGAVDHEEFHARIVEIFFATDANKDGYLGGEELKQLAFPDDFTADDKDHDGRVSMREFLRVRFVDFDHADTDHDGVLSVEEVTAAFEGRRPR